MFSLNDLMHAMGDGTSVRHPMYQSRAGFYPGTSRPHPRCGGYEPFYFNNLFGEQNGSDFPTNCHKLVSVAEVLGDILQAKCRGSKQQQQQQQSAKQRQEKTTETKAETPAPGNYCGNKKDKPKYHKTSRQNETHHEPTFQDVIGNVLSAIHQSQHNQRQQTESRWQTKVDCRGFSLNDIKVKVDSEARQLLLKAFKKEESKNGVRTSSLRKSVALPETVDPKQVKCKLSSDGFLLVEAPYVEKRETERKPESHSPHGLVGDLMTTLFPGFLGFVEDHNKTKDGEEDKNESKEMTQGEQKTCRQTEQMNNGTAKQKEKSQIQKSENMLDVKSTKLELNFDENQANDEQGLVAMSSKKTSQVERESSQHQEVQEAMKTTTTNENCETDPRAQIMETEKTHFLVKSSDSSKCHHDPTVASLCPENETVEEKVKDNNINDDDSSSTASDDSFVLLSQLGQEITDNLINHVDSITPDNCDQNVKVKGQIIINASSDVSPLDPNNMADNHQQIPTQDTQNENTTVTTTVNDQRVDRSDKKDDVVLFRLEMPSYNPDSLQVTFDQSSRVVTITATKGNHMTRSRRPSDTISRSVALDDSVDENGLQCFYSDGTLTVTAPRKTSVRTIPIKL